MITTMVEWKQMPEHPEYKVSNGGDVMAPSGCLLKPHPTNGYQRVSLGNTQRYVHRLVLEAFVGPCPPGKQCRHLNGDKADNKLTNLAWGTPSENNYDRVRHGTHPHTKRTLCPKGHPLDGVKYNADGSVKQRRCMTCNREWGRKRRARKTRCPQGHLFDGVRYKADGTVRQRYCTVCVGAQLAKGRSGR